MAPSFSPQIDLGSIIVTLTFLWAHFRSLSKLEAKIDIMWDWFRRKDSIRLENAHEWEQRVGQ